MMNNLSLYGNKDFYKFIYDVETCIQHDDT
jgi:hypothetical protein